MLCRCEGLGLEADRGEGHILYPLLYLHVMS